MRRGRVSSPTSALLAPTLILAIWTGCTSSRVADRRSIEFPIEAGRADAGSPSLAAGVGIVELLGQAEIAGDTLVDLTPVGGLSGLAYDAERGLYYAISDDPASRGPARFFTLTIDLSEGSLAPGAISVTAMTPLLDPHGAPFGEMSLDGEGIAVTPEGTLYISSEGQADRGVDPFLREFGLDGKHRRAFPVAPRFLPRASKNRGIRHNLGFESLTVSPSGLWFYSSTENALRQDGPESDVGVPSPARILRYERATGRRSAEYVYQVEPVTAEPPDPDGFRTRGLVELLAVDDEHLLALERSYTQGVGNAIDLFLIDLATATNVLDRRRLAGKSYRPVEKTRLLELAVLGLELDNIEGMTFGPRLADGRRTLVMVADNNFNPRQRNQVLAFAIGPHTPGISAIQGAGHRSPLAGAWVRGVRGVVTAPAARGGGFWMQAESDGDDATSDAVLVLPEQEHSIQPGARVAADGLIREHGFPGALTVTRLEEALVVSDGAGDLPAAVGLGPAGRPLPRGEIDDDELAVFEPTDDVVDFFESLEGMRVALPFAEVIGPTSRFGEFAVVLGGGEGEGPRSIANGLVATAEDVNPERLLVVSRDREAAPDVAVGDRFRDPIEGIVDYAFGTFRVLVDGLPSPVATGRRPETTSLRAAADALVVASYNVENLSAQSGEEKYRRVARSIVENLGSPAVVALQEIQDDTGSEDDGTIGADTTLRLLVEAIASAGGPSYAFRQVDPANLADGGRPGANIRVAFLYRPDRVDFVARGQPDARSEVEILVDERGPFLSPNPSRVEPDHPAFAGDATRNLSGVRKPLAIEFEFNGRRLFLVNLHMRSKRGDSPLFGSAQPPVRASEPLRSGEARVVRDFVSDLLELDPNAAIVLLGDFNEHPYRPPVRLLVDGGLTNLVEQVPVAERYTFIYRGNSQVLDNFLVSRSLIEGGTPEIDIVHMNADFPHRVRAADHDAIVVRLHVDSSDPAFDGLPQNDS